MPNITTKKKFQSIKILRLIFDKDLKQSNETNWETILEKKIIIKKKKKWRTISSNSLRKNCSYSEFFWFIFSRIRTECGDIRCIFQYSVQMRENIDQENSEYGHFSSSG